MSLRINDEAPDFSAETTQGTINFHDWIGNGRAILFSHPKDFTPVCTTELGYLASLQPEFAKRNCKVVGLSVDPVSSHGKWAADSPDKKIKPMLVYPMSTGRNFDEVLRVLDSMQLTAVHKVATQALPSDRPPAELTTRPSA